MPDYSLLHVALLLWFLVLFVLGKMKSTEPNPLSHHRPSGVSFDDTFLTDLESQVHSCEEGVEEVEERITQFVCPPPPVFTRRKYYSLNQNDAFGRHYLSEWEKKALLSRLKGQEPIDDEAFQDRLSYVNERNSYPYIQSVQERAVTQSQEELTDKMECVLHAERRRSDIFFRFKNLPMLRTLDKFIARAEIWYKVIVSHVFITALIQERKVQEALETFSFLMTPMVHRFVALKRLRAERHALTERMLPQIPYPFPQVIQSMEGMFFQGWPPFLLEQMTAKAKPMYMKKGQYLMHEGDLGRAMFIVTSGTIMIVFKKKNKDKRRSVENCSGTLSLRAPCYVGEFALVCKEPRTASIMCETDIGFWTVSVEDYESVAKLLSPLVASKQREATDARRRQNLKKLFPLKVEFLRKFPFFEKFSDEGLTKIIDNVEPIVLHDGDFLIASGVLDSSVYFIQDGIAVHRDEDGTESKITKGTCIGMFECSCGVNEKKRTSIVSINYCDIWRMRREVLMDVGMSEPHALLHCRKASKNARALAMKKEAKTPSYLLSDPYLSFCFLSSHLSRLYQLCSPCVFLNGERLVLMGQSLTAFLIIVNGAVDVTVANHGEQESFRLVAAHKDKKDGNQGAKGLTYVLGAYEFAASLNKYTCTATSYGLTEVFIVDLHEVNTIIPPELKCIIMENLRGKELVTRAYKEKDFSILNSSKSVSFSHVYRTQRDKELQKRKKM